MTRIVDRQLNSMAGRLGTDRMRDTQQIVADEYLKVYHMKGDMGDSFVNGKGGKSIQQRRAAGEDSETALQMAIKLLQLNKLELEQTLQQEMVENPILEDGADVASTDQDEPVEEAADRPEAELVIP